MTAEERKQNTEKLLATFGIPIPHELPPMEEEDSVVLKTPQQIAVRILVLAYLNCMAAQDGFKQEIVNFLKQEALWEEASEAEKMLFGKTQLTDEEATEIAWRGESIWLLLWTINKVDRLDLPVNEVTLDEVFERIPAFMSSTSDFVNSATIRSLSEILDQSDLIFRLTWALRQAHPHGVNEMALNESVAYERYYAISWLTSLRPQWDAT